MRKHLLAIALIITGAPGCDNVAWAGADFAVRSPPEREVAAETEAEPVDSTEAARVTGPILLAGTREEERARMVVVGEIIDDALRAFPDPAYPEDSDRLAALSEPGSEWILFSEGVRIGHFIVESAGVAQGFCSGRVALDGVVEMVPGAATAERLLALPEAAAAGRARGEYEELQHDYDQRVASLSIAGEAIPRNGATWPEQGVLDAREHIQAFRMPELAAPSIAATFMAEDRLALGAPGRDAYSLFVIGEERGGAFVEAYSWFQDAAANGKAAPRYFDHLDLDGDGSQEVVLDVFGSSARWFAGLTRRDGQWVRTYNDRCGGPAS